MFSFFRCNHCNQAITWPQIGPICSQCRELLRFGFNSEKSGAATANVDHPRAVWSLIEPTYALLKTWKKTGGYPWKRILDPWVRQYCEENLIPSLQPGSSRFPQALVPIPQSWERLWTLGHQPAHTAAELFGRALRVPVLPLLLESDQQRGPSRVMRQAQRNRFDRHYLGPQFHWKWNEAYPITAFQSVWVVDDFATTGETLSRARRILLQTGISNSESLVLGLRPITQNQPTHVGISAGAALSFKTTVSS